MAKKDNNIIPLEGGDVCPLCGKPSMEKYTANPFPKGWIGCPSCHLYINWQGNMYARQSSIERWNTRVKGEVANG